MAEFYFVLDTAVTIIADGSQVSISPTKRAYSDLTAGTGNNEIGTFKSGISPSAYTPSAIFTGALTGGYIVMLGLLDAASDRMLPVRWAGSPMTPGASAVLLEIFKENPTYDDGEAIQEGHIYKKYKVTTL